MHHRNNTTATSSIKQWRGQKPMKTEKRANIYHSDMENDRVQTYKRIVSTMFNDDVINMGRIIVLFAITSQMEKQYPTDAWKFGTFTMLLIKSKNTNTSIDRSYTNENIGKGTNQKAPFHKQLTNRNT